jgi:hypothetical protein
MADQDNFLYDAVTEEQVVAFLELWMDVVANMARYSTNNRIVAQNLRRLHAVLQEVGGTRRELEVSELHSTVLVGGRPLSTRAHNTVAVGAFGFMMLKHNIRGLRIRARVPLDEFSTLMERLAQARPLPDNFPRNVTHLVFGNDITIELQAVMPGDEEGDGLSDEFSPLLSRRTSLGGSPPTAVRSAISPRLAAERNAAVAGVPIKFLIRVGGVPLEGAEVTHCGGSEHGVTGPADQGVTLHLPEGEHEVEISFDPYRVRRPVIVDENDQLIEVDLQQIFDYSGE